MGTGIGKIPGLGLPVCSVAAAFPAPFSIVTDAGDHLGSNDEILWMG